MSDNRKILPLLNRLAHTVPAALSRWNRRRVLKAALRQIALRPGDHLLDDVGIDRNDPRLEADCRNAPSLHRFWML